MRLRAAMLCTMLAAACGGSDGASPDAAVGVDAGPDASVDAAPLDAAGTRSLAVTPASHDYGTVQLGCGLSNDFHFTSTGTAAIGPLQTSLTGSTAFQITADTCNGHSLPPSETCDVTVRSQPSAVGAQSGLLTVVAGSIPAVAQLTAVAVSAGSSTITPSLQNYGLVLVGQTSAPVTYTVTNTGGSPLGPLVTTITGADAASFAPVTDACTGMLNPGASCTTSVRFAPAAVGAKTATLNVMGSAPCGYASATLNGTGVVNDLTLTPGTQDFGEVLVNFSSSDAVFTVTNTGTTTSAPLTVTLGGGPGDFEIAGGTCVSGTTTLGPGATCSVLVHFRPPWSGVMSGSLTVTPMNGIAVSAALTGTGVFPILGISPNVHDFGTVVAGSSSAGVTFTLTNIGFSRGPLGVAFSGTNASDFTVTADSCSGVTLPAGGSCTVTVAFTPGTIGAKFASLDVTTPLVTGHASASLGGTGVAP